MNQRNRLVKNPGDLLEACRDTNVLPSLPAVVVKLIDLCGRDDIGLRELSECISKDPALSAQIIRSVNSSFYGVREKVTTLSHAVNLLGLRTVKMISLGACYVKTYRAVDGANYDLGPFWKRTVYAAAASRSICSTLKLADVDEIFLAALVQDLGVLGLLSMLKAQYARVLEFTGHDFSKLPEIENQLLGIDHTAIGQAIAESWNMPEQIRVPIAYHEKPDVSPPEYRARAMLVALGATAADVYVSQDSSEHVKRLAQQASDWFQIDNNQVSDIMDGLQQQVKEVAEIFEIRDLDEQHEAQIAFRAKSLLHELTMQAQQELHQVTQSKRQVEDGARKDPLTGVANRGHFNRVFCQYCRESIRHEWTLSLMMIDCDHFKKVNDTYGHLVGDEVLKVVSATLVDKTPEKSLVARIGGEEFAVIVPDLTRNEVIQLAENLRATIEGTTVTTEEGTTLNVTASFGVATQAPSQPFELPLDFIRVADECAYAAKGAGRNCVRHAASDDPEVRAAQPENVPVT